VPSASRSRPRKTARPASSAISKVPVRVLDMVGRPSVGDRAR
jgi:hypothetical protein